MMSHPQPPASLLPPPRRSRLRRLLQSFVVMLAFTACCMSAGLLIDRTGWRVDLTATREHQISERTLATIQRLPAPAQLVVTYNSALADPAAARRTRDVLDTLARSSNGKVGVEVIDLATDTNKRLDSVLSSLAGRSESELQRENTALKAIASGLRDAGSAFDRLDQALTNAAKALPQSALPDGPAVGRALSDSAAVCRLSSKDLTESISAAEQQLAQFIPGTSIPPFDAAAAMLRRPLPTITTQLQAMGRTIETLAAAKDEQVPATVKDRLRAVPAIITSTRDALLRSQQSIDDLPRPAVLTVARVLERSSAAIAISETPPPDKSASGQRTLAAVDVDALFPPRTQSTVANPSIDMRARTEELIGSALASLSDAAGPIIVLMHSEPARMAPNFDRFALSFERLRNRGMDVVEWPVSLDPQPPSFAKLNPSGHRPVVYAALYTLPGTTEAAERIARFANTVRDLVAKGRPLLLSLNPSTLPSIGQPDLMVDFLEPLGLKADSGRPILRQLGPPNAPFVSPEAVLISKGGDHPLAAATKGLRCDLPWAVSMEAVPNAPSIVTPLLWVEDDDKTWAESQWIEFRAVRADQRANIRPEDQPRKDSARDNGKGPWVVAAAIERKIADGPAAQRLVVVGSSGWYLDDVAAAATFDNNRYIPSYPGNAELLESSLFWLAGQEQAIGISPTSASAPVIPDLSPSAVLALRWVLIFGLPLLVLVLGAAWRLIRG